MKILRLRIENLNSLRLKQSIDFVEAPLGETSLFAITGDTGAGKTTILDAITLALYGRVHRNKEVTEVMSYGATESLAEVEFASAKGIFRAKWSTYRSRGKLDGNIQAPRRELAQWDEKKQDFRIIAEKIREVDSGVEEVSGLDYDRFTRSVLLSQGDFAAFLQAGERERSELLERITGTEIYTRLSIAAYERAKEEQIMLEDLRKQQQALQLLSKEEIAAIDKQLLERQQRAGQLRNELQTLREQIQWYHQKAELETRQNDLQGRESEFQKKKLAFQADEQRLEAHLRAQPYQSLLEKTEAGEVQLDRLTQELLDLQTEEERLQVELRELEQQLQVQQAALSVCQQQKKQQYPIFDQVIALDKDLAVKTEELTRVTDESTTLEQEINTLKAESSRSKDRLEAAEKELQQLIIWLQKESGRSQLGVLLPEVDGKREDMRKVILEQKQWEERRDNLLQDQAVLEKQYEQLSGELVRAKEQLEHWNSEFKKDLPAGYALGRNELLRALHQDIELLGEQQKQLEQLQQFNTEYQDLLIEMSEYEAQIENLNGQETALDKEVISLMDALDWTLEQLNYKQHIYEQQQLIANYEKDRHQLPEGEPCPLCQSIHHPFRDHPIKLFVDRARTDYEKYKKTYEKLQSKQTQLLNQQKEIKIQKEQLMGTELEELGGQMARQFKRIELLEDRLAGMILGLKPGAYDQDRGPALESKVAEAGQTIARKKLVRDRLVTISERLDEQENTVQQLEINRQESHNELKLLAIRLNDHTDQLANVQARYETLLVEVGRIFQQFGQQFEPDTAREVYQSLKKDYELFVRQTERQQELVQQTALERQKVEQLLQEEKKEMARYQKLQARQQEVAENTINLQEKRLELLGDKDPLQEKEKLEQSLEIKGELVNTLKEQLQTLQTQLKSLTLLQKSKGKEEKELQKDLNNWLDQLTQAATTAGFADWTTLARALLQLEEADALVSAKNALDREALAISQSLQDLENNLQKLLHARTVDTPLEALQDHLSSREEDYQVLQQTIGGLTERLTANDKQRQAAGALVKQIAVQEKEFTRWAQLSEIIGQADGKKFRIFAQGLTLSKLVELANYHLESLNGRYLIRKRSDEDLELEIIDTFQADNARSMNTLSGGESFLVSLALALGLSDMAGRDARIQSLFIDEGFGTLDENSLDMAIDTLENLQSNGKIIGIISHVKALKERIGTQIQVTKKGTGFSEIAIVG